jgi:hypothetical protein
LCDEHGIGGGGEYCGENGAQLDRTNVFYHEAPGGKYVPRAEFIDLGPVVIGAVRVAARLALPSRKPRGKNWAKDHYKRVENQFF